MQRKLTWIYRGFLAVLFITTFWAVWADAQVVATNAPPTSGGGGAGGGLLSKLHEDYLTFGLDHVGLLREYTLLGEPLWKYLASLIYILLAFYVSKFLDYIVNAWLKRWASKTETKLDDLLLELLHGPVKVIAFVIFLHIGLTVFQWPPATEHFLSKSFVLIVAFSVTYAALKLVDLMMGVWRERTVTGTDRTFDEQLFPVVRKTVKVFIFVVAVLVTWQNLSEKPITAILASLSIGGLAVGLAAQDTLANLFGAVAVYVDKPFRIGDRIQLDGVDGTVENIGLRSTRVRSLEGHHVIVPNKTMGNAIITNISRRLNIKTEMNIGIACETTTDQLKRALALLEEIYRADKKTADLIISFNKFADSSLNVFVVHWWNGTDQKAHFAAMQELNLKIKERFDTEGIAFAFPTQTVYLKPDAEWQPKSSGS